MSKITMKSLARLCIGKTGFLCGGKISKPMMLPIEHNARLPFLVSFVPCDTLRAASLIGPPVVLILRPRRASKVRPSVVQPVAVDMVDFKACGAAHKEAMQANNMTAHSARIAASRIYRVSIGRHPCAPVAACNQRHVFNVDDGCVSLGKGNKGNVALNADFAYRSWHVATSLAAMGGLSLQAPRPPLWQRKLKETTHDRRS